MFKWSDLEFPNRVIALIITAVAVALILGFTRIAYGQITITSPVAGAFVYTAEESEPQPLPFTKRVRSGKYSFIVDAPGYVAKEAMVTTVVFRHSKLDLSLEKSPYDFSKPEAIPLYKDLPYETTHFRVDAPNDNGEYRVTLTTDLNGVDDYALYQKQLSEYGQEVVAWMKSKGVDASKLSIIWLPEKPSAVTAGVSDPRGVIIQKRWWEFWR